MTRVVVVGGGAAGAALAARLSADPANEVTLIEDGSAEPVPAELLDGGTIPGAVPGHRANWGHVAELQPGRPTVVPRGKGLGGSTAINGGYFVRAQPGDFARWAAAGGPAWSFEQALPLLAALEHDLDFGSAPGHGTAGPMRVKRPPQQGVLAAAFHRAAHELGFPEEPDKNRPGTVPGVGAVPSNIIDGVRVNTALAYLTPAVRSRLTILGDTRALRVRIAGGRATGVEVRTGTGNGDGQTATIPADEVVLCAGAVQTPQLLLLSGIGPRAQLDAHGIAVVADLPVGEGFSDHPNLAVGWRPTARFEAAQLAAGQPPMAFPAALNLDSSGAAGRYPEGDLEVLLVAQPAGALFGQQPGSGTPEMQLLVALQQPRSRGRLSLGSADPLDAPRIEYRYLEDADDRARMRTGVRTAAALLRSRAFTALFDSFVSLDAATLADDAKLDAWVLDHLGTAIHLSGTAAMGAVTDGAGCVRGVAGLRVADTSLLPTVPSRGPFNTAVLIGELIAAQLLGRSASR